MVSKNKYYIYNIYNEPHLEIISKGFLAPLDKLVGMGHKLYIRKLDGSDFSTIIKKVGITTEEFIINYGKNKKATIKKQIKNVSRKINIITKDEEYIIEGNILDKDFIISRNYLTVAKVTKCSSNSINKYKLDIFEDKNKELFLSSVIAIDKSIHK